MIVPRGNGVVSNRQTTSGRLESSGTQNTLSMVNTASSFIQKYQVQKDETQYQDAVNQALKKKNEWKASNLTREGKAAEGLTEDFLSFNKNIEEEIGSNLSTNARAKFNQWQTRDTEQDKLGVMMHQRKQDQFVKQSTFGEGLAISEEAIRLDAKNNWPKAFEHADQTLQNGVQAGVIAPEQFEAKRVELHNKLRTETAKNYYTQDKHDFMKSGINELGLGESEKAAYQEKYQRDLMADQRERKSLFAEEARSLYGKKDDMAAQATQNEDTTHFAEAAKKFESMGYPQYASEMREQKALYDKTIVFNAEHKNAPLKEKYTAAMSREIGQDLDGSGMELKANQTIQREVIKEVKQFNSDPAAYVEKFAVGGNNEEIAESRISLQRSQGFAPEKGFQVLTNQQKTTYKGSFESGDIKQKTALIQEASSYGKHASQVIKEIGAEPALAFAPYIKDKTQLELLVAASSEKGLITDDGQKSQYNRETKNSQFYQTLAKVQKEFPTNTDLTDQLISVEKVALGISGRKMDSGAGAKFFDDQFHMEEDTDKIIYFPKDLEPDEVISALDAKKQSLVGSLNLQDSQAKSVARWSINDMKWINSPSGFFLADPKTGRKLPGSDVPFNETSKIYNAELTKRQKTPQNTVGMNSFSMK